MNAKLAILWLTSAMRAWLPISEGPEVERYEQIAADALAASQVAEPIFKGDRESGQLKTALLILSIARYEGHYRKDVDDGRRRGDGGKSWCLAQVLFPGDNSHRSLVVQGGSYRWSSDPDEGWTGKDLVGDRFKCFAAAIAIARDSYQSCGNLSLYTSGACRRDEPKARVREGTAKAWLSKHPLAPLLFDAAAIL